MENPDRIGRPRNETAADLRAENAAKVAVEQAHPSRRLIKLGPNDLDWRMETLEGKTVGWCEFKRRYNTKDTYPTLDLSLMKWQKGIDLFQETGLSFLLLVEWEDTGVEGVRYKPELGYSTGTLRRRRGQPGDTEPCICIPIDEFKVITPQPSQTRLHVVRAA